MLMKQIASRSMKQIEERLICVLFSNAHQTKISPLQTLCSHWLTTNETIWHSDGLAVVSYLVMKQGKIEVTCLKHFFSSSLAHHHLHHYVNESKHGDCWKDTAAQYFCRDATGLNLYIKCKPSFIANWLTSACFKHLTELLTLLNTFCLFLIVLGPLQKTIGQTAIIPLEFYALPVNFDLIWQWPCIVQPMGWKLLTNMALCTYTGLLPVLKYNSHIHIQ